MPMINQLTNQFMAMDPKHAKSLVGSLALQNKTGVTVFDATGQVEVNEKPRINDVLAGYHGGVDSYDQKPFHFIDGIAVIPVTGTLLHKLSWSSSWATGYNYIVSKFDAANADPDVKGILLVINSPGGTVAGCFDAADHIAENKGAKPLWAIYDDMACSGAMCIGSVADKRFTTQTALSGSIGVVQIHASYEEMLNDAGLAVTLIYSGSHKVDGNPYKNLPDDVYESFKSQCDNLRGQFAEKVASNIGLSLDDVMATEAKTYTGQQAVDAGLADEVINAHQILSHFNQHLSDSDSSTLRNITMSDQTTPVAEESVDTVAEAQESAPAPNAAADERQRIGAIVNAPEAEGRTDLARHLAFETDMSAEAAVSVLKASPMASVASNENSLDAAMAGTEQPNITAMADDAEESEASQFVAAYKHVVGEK